MMTSTVELYKIFIDTDGNRYMFVKEQTQCVCGRKYKGKEYEDLKHGCHSCYGRR